MKISRNENSYCQFNVKMVYVIVCRNDELFYCLIYDNFDYGMEIEGILIAF